MRILTVAGVSRQGSSNVELLKSLGKVCTNIEFTHFDTIGLLPLFTAEADVHPWDSKVLEWRQSITNADAVIISTPEYVHNIPAQLKSALEWIASSGELVRKPTLAMTYTPHEPRGEKAMQSLLWTLSALDANIVTQLSLYRNRISIDGQGNITSVDNSLEQLTSAIQLLVK